MIVSGRPSVTYYDAFGRYIQTHAQNQTGGIDTKTTSYTFSSQPLTATHRHDILTASGNLSRHTFYTEKYTYTYDAIGRLTEILHSIDGKKAVSIKKVDYNSIGQVNNISIGDNLLSIGYGYDVQGRNYSISSPVFNETATFESASGRFRATSIP